MNFFLKILLICLRKTDDFKGLIKGCVELNEKLPYFYNSVPIHNFRNSKSNFSESLIFLICSLAPKFFPILQIQKKYFFTEWGKMQIFIADCLPCLWIPTGAQSAMLGFSSYYSSRFLPPFCCEIIFRCSHIRG